MLLACFLPVRLVAIVYAVLGAWRARFTPAWLLGVSLVATTLLPAYALASPNSALASLVIAGPWAPPLVAAVAGGMATRSAFTALENEPAISVRREPLIDAGLCVVAALGAFVTSRGEL